MNIITVLLEAEKALLHMCENTVATEFYDAVVVDRALRSIREKIKQLDSVDPVGYMYPDDYERMTSTETFCTVYSVPVGSPDKGQSSVVLYSSEDIF